MYAASFGGRHSRMFLRELFELRMKSECRAARNGEACEVAPKFNCGIRADVPTK